MNPAQPLLPASTVRSADRSRAATVHRRHLLHRVSHLATLALLVCFAAFVVVLAAFTVYGIRHEDHAYAGVTVAGVDVGGKSGSDISSLIDQHLSAYERQPVTLTANGETFTATLADLGVSIDREATVARAMDYGRSGSWWERSIAWTRALLDDQDVDPVVVVDATAFRTHLQAVAPGIVAAPQNAYVQMAGGQPTLVEDVPGVSINVAATRSLVTDHVRNLGDDPVAISLISVPAPVNAAAIESGVPEAQRAVSRSVNLQAEEGTWPIKPERLTSLVWVDDAGKLRVHEDAARTAIEEIAASIDRPAQDAAITVDENGAFVVVPSVAAAAVDVDASTDALSAALLAGETNVPLVVERAAPQITDQMATDWAARADALAGQGVTVTWSDQTATVSRGELIWAMVIEPRPGEKEPFRLSFDQGKLAESMQPIADHVYQDAQDAQFRLVDGDIRIEAEAVTGRQVDLDASVQAVVDAATNGSFKAPLKVDEIAPAFTSDDRVKINLDDVLGDSSTWYGDSSEPRAHNVERAVTLENGWLIPPGGEFSYAKVMGLVTPENGFVTGFGIVADPSGGVTTAPVVGGGICQVSTTIFQAAFWAGLEITERHQHPYWLLAYGEPPRGMQGLDAMVNIEPDWALDLKFRNTTKDWIALVVYADGQTVSAQILGTDQGWTVDVADPVITNVVKSDPNKMIYTDSPELPKGKQLQVEYAKDGFDASITRRVRDRNGNLVSEYTLDSSYAASRNTTLRGTGPAESASGNNG